MNGNLRTTFHSRNADSRDARARPTHEMHRSRSECVSRHARSRIGLNFSSSTSIADTDCMTNHAPFETSLSARLLLAAATVVTIGGGLVPWIGLNPSIAPPVILAAGGVTAFVA